MDKLFAIYDLAWELLMYQRQYV